jgi:hypothetical protein
MCDHQEQDPFSGSRPTSFGLVELIVVCLILLLLAMFVLRGVGVCMGVSRSSFDRIYGGASKLRIQILLGAKGQPDGNALRQLGAWCGKSDEDIYETVSTEDLKYCTERWDWRSKADSQLIRVCFLDGKAVCKIYRDAATPPSFDRQDLRQRRETTAKEE